MSLPSLPYLALKNVIEHLVVVSEKLTVVRLRRVCRLFDEEITSLVFGSRSTKFCYQNHRPRDRYLRAAFLKGRCLWSHNFPPNPLVTIIHATAQILLPDLDCSIDRHSLSRLYQQALCDAAVLPLRHLGHDLNDMIEKHPGLSLGELEDPTHMLAAAAAVGNLSRVQSLLSSHSLFNISSPVFGCALVNATRIGHETIVALLLESITKGVVFSKKLDVSGEIVLSTPEAILSCIAKSLGTACENNYENILRQFASYTDGLRSLPEDCIINNAKRAAYHGRLELVKWLLELLPEPSKDTCLKRSLIASCSGGNIKLVGYLLNSGADINVFCEGPRNVLGVAAQRGHTEVVKLLLKHDIKWVSITQHNALYLAAINGHKETIQAILESGIDYGGLKTIKGAFRGAVSVCENEVVQMLINIQPNFARDKSGISAIQSAAAHGYIDTIELLIKNGASLKECESTNEPMLSALKYNQQHVVKFFLRHGLAAVDPMQTSAAADFASGRYPQDGGPVGYKKQRGGHDLFFR